MSYFETVIKARELIHADKIHETIEATAYHGFRSKKPLDQIKKEGISYPYDTYLNALADAKEVFAYFKVKSVKLLDLWSQDMKERFCIWITLREEDVCGWATRSPECVFNALLLVVDGRSVKRIAELTYGYRNFRYGLPIAATLKLKIPARDIFGSAVNIPLRRKKIEPYEIISLSYCKGVIK